MHLKVLILGADVATLTLALILERAGIDYLLLEQSESVPGGGAVAGGMTLHPTILPLLEQLLLRDDLLFSSLPLEQVDLLGPEMDFISSLDYSDRQTRYGAWSRFMTRPEYCDMVLEKLNESRVLFGQEVTSIITTSLSSSTSTTTPTTTNTTTPSSSATTTTTTTKTTPTTTPLGSVDGWKRDSGTGVGLASDRFQSEKTLAGEAPLGGVRVQCADGSIFEGHLLVGDRGCGLGHKITFVDQDTGFSSNSNKGVRNGQQHPQEQASTAREIQYHVTGITGRLDPQRIPLLKEDTTQFRIVLDPSSSISWWAATLVDNRIAWQVTKRISLSEKSAILPEDAHNPTEVDQMANTVMKHITHQMVCPLGGSMAQLVQWTSPSSISCQRQDDRGGSSPFVGSPRIVLIGEACKKVIPILGQAPDESILDALALGDLLFHLPSTDVRDIKATLDQYHRQRTSRREAAIDESRELDLLLNAKGPLRRLYRSLVLNCTPKCIVDRRNDEKYMYRPQATFLNPVPDYGLVQPNGSRHSSSTRLALLTREKR